jgi:hypothetical protein
MTPFLPFWKKQKEKVQPQDQLTLPIEEPYIQHPKDEEEKEYQVIIIEVF